MTKEPKLSERIKINEITYSSSLFLREGVVTKKIAFFLDGKREEGN